MTQFLQRTAASLPRYWKLATIRCSIYTLTVGWAYFAGGMEGFDSFAEMTDFQIIKLIGGTIVAMLLVWIAFLDQTMSKLPPTTPPSI